jgi:TolB-like protein
MKMNGKKIFFCVFLTLLSVKIFSQTMTLDKSIETVANGIIKQILMRNIPEVFDFSSSIKTITVAILDFDSSSNALSEYVSYDLTKYFLGNMRFTVVDRLNLDRARKELNFNMSFEVNEENAQRIGHFVGAQVVIFGSIKPLGNMYRMQARAITVEKGIVLAQESINIIKRDIEKITGTRESLFNDWNFFNGLCMVGYTYTPDLPVGFSVSAGGIYISFNFGWKDYNEGEHNKMDSTIGYNITIIPNILYLPIGGGVAKIRNHPGGYYQEGYGIFEVGFLLKLPNDVGPYISGTYRYKGGEHTFAISAGICGDIFQMNL